MSDDDRVKRIKELERRITDLKDRMPAHSAKAEMLMQLEALEEGLERMKNKH